MYICTADLAVFFLCKYVCSSDRFRITFMAAVGIDLMAAVEYIFHLASWPLSPAALLSTILLLRLLTLLCPEYSTIFFKLYSAGGRIDRWPFGHRYRGPPAFSSLFSDC